MIPHYYAPVVLHCIALGQVVFSVPDYWGVRQYANRYDDPCARQPGQVLSSWRSGVPFETAENAI